MSHQVVKFRVFTEERFPLLLLITDKILDVHIKACWGDAFRAQRGLLTLLKQQGQQREQRMPEKGAHTHTHTEKGSLQASGSRVACLICWQHVIRTTFGINNHVYAGFHVLKIWLQLRKLVWRWGWREKEAWQRAVVEKEDYRGRWLKNACANFFHIKFDLI